MWSKSCGLWSWRGDLDVGAPAELPLPPVPEGMSGGQRDRRPNQLPTQHSATDSAEGTRMPRSQEHSQINVKDASGGELHEKVNKREPPEPTVRREHAKRVALCNQATKNAREGGERRSADTPTQPPVNGSGPESTTISAPVTEMPRRRVPRRRACAGWAARSRACRHRCTR